MNEPPTYPMPKPVCITCLKEFETLSAGVCVTCIRTFRRADQLEREARDIRQSPDIRCSANDASQTDTRPMSTIQQMTEAMTAELASQTQSHYRAPVRTQSGKTLLDGWFDLEAVARAGLAAIVEPARATADAGANAQYWPRSLGGEATACVGKAAALAAWRAMISEMLVPATEETAS